MNPNVAHSTLAADLDMFLSGTLPEFQSMQVGNDALDWLNFLGVSEVHPLPQSDGSDHGRRFRFLYNFTSLTGLGPTFDCGTPSQRQHLQPFLSQDLCELAPSGDLSGSSEIPITESQSNSSWLFDPLVVKIHDIVSELKEIVTKKSRKSFITLSWTQSIEQQCLDFFSPSNIRSMLTSYWAFWHPNVNFVHKPTFKAATAKSSLLAAMVAIGVF